MAKFTREQLTKTDLFINGEWIKSNKRFSVHDPATGNSVAEVSDAIQSHFEQAINAADTAFQSWKNTSCEERANLLRTWFNLMMEHQHELGEIMTLEQGKPLAEAKGEVAYGASFVEWFAEEAKRTRGDVLPPFADDKRTLVIKQPVGVVAAITPWNFPNAMITRKVAPALAAGCTVVVKPPALTPLSSLALMLLAEEAGIPKGVINILPSTDAEMAGKTLTSSPKVRKLSFTGSTPVGKILMKQCAEQVTTLSLELGGNAPFIVFDDADLDVAVEQLIASKFRNAGQTCISANRVLVQKAVHQRFIEKLESAMGKIRVGNGFTDSNADIGPLINQDAIDKVTRLINDAKDNGARMICGGKVCSDLGPLFFEPTLLDNVNQSMEIANEEIFGPVLAVQTFADEDEGIALANNTPFGLAAYFCAQDPARIKRVAEAIESGLVGINAGGISHAMHPFGGVKQSGLGREGSHYGIDEYLEIKTLVVGDL